MTPDEAEKAIEQGFGARLMADWWVGKDENIFVLCPASLGYEGKDAPEISLFNLFSGLGQCTFLKDNLCEIHDSGFKPLLCRETLCCGEHYPSKEQVVPLWNTDRGRALVERWRAFA
jgi:Fe-S-cluster containining protein